MNQKGGEQYIGSSQQDDRKKRQTISRRAIYLPSQLARSWWILLSFRPAQGCQSSLTLGEKDRSDLIIPRQKVVDHSANTSLGSFRPYHIAQNLFTFLPNFKSSISDHFRHILHLSISPLLSLSDSPKNTRKISPLLLLSTYPVAVGQAVDKTGSLHRLHRSIYLPSFAFSGLVSFSTNFSSLCFLTFVFLNDSSVA